MDRPILFSKPMVRAILREIKAPGTGKTQTRRVLKPQPPANARYSGIHYASDEPNSWFFNSPRGPMKVRERYEGGERLWVRESLECANGEAIGYPADGTWLPNTPWRWQRAKLPSIHMPRWASRITLHVTDVRVERLQDISEEDAIAEGIEEVTNEVASRDKSLRYWRRYRDGGWNGYVDNPIGSYASLWTEINGPGSYEANPWVAAISYRPVLTNIDAGGE